MNGLEDWVELRSLSTAAAHVHACGPVRESRSGDQMASSRRHGESVQIAWRDLLIYTSVG